MIKLLRNSACLALGLLLIMPAFADDEDAGRRIEEVVVYGERVESTVSDTSISITAMDSEFLSDMGIQGPNEMMNFIPATTRTDWDVKIRGIGRNFRGLGGDAGVPPPPSQGEGEWRSPARAGGAPAKLTSTCVGVVPFNPERSVQSVRT